MQKVRIGKRHRGHAYAASGSSKGPRATKDYALATEWGNALQELGSSADQEEIKYAQVDLGTYGWGWPGDTGMENIQKWLDLPNMPEYPRISDATDTRVGRDGRSVIVKSIDVSFNFATEADATEVAAGTMMQPRMRIIILLDKFPVAGAPDFAPTSVLDLLPDHTPGAPGTEYGNYINFNAMLNQDYKDRFIIIDDIISAPKDTALARHNIQWNAAFHYDTDFRVSFDDTTADTGAPFYCVENCLRILAFSDHTRFSPDNEPTVEHLFSSQIRWSVQTTYTDA